MQASVRAARPAEFEMQARCRRDAGECVSRERLATLELDGQSGERT